VLHRCAKMWAACCTQLQCLDRSNSHDRSYHSDHDR
jgi:hypothetical protein